MSILKLKETGKNKGDINMEDNGSRDEYFYQQGYVEGYIKGQQIAMEEVYKFFKNTDKLPTIVDDKVEIKNSTLL